ncbi:MAG: site-specific integrase, partial [Eubacteriaceae bacterium]|nr:site-specific integrase [Eubacteriaceae bacterium]
MSKKKNANGMGTIKHRSDGRWEAQYSVGTDAKTGKAIRRSVYGKTQGETRMKLLTALNEASTDELAIAASFTLEEWLRIWLDEYCGSIKFGTLVTYKASVENHIIPHLGAMQLHKLTNMQIQRMYNSIDLSPKTVKNVHGVLHKALLQAKICGYIKQNPSDGVVLPRIEKTEVKPLNSREIAMFMDFFKGSEYEAPMLFAVFTGLRVSELIGLDWSCIDFDRGLIRVYRQLLRVKEKGVPVRYEFSSTKNSKARIVPAAPFVLELLRSVKEKQNENEA